MENNIIKTNRDVRTVNCKSEVIIETLRSRGIKPVFITLGEVEDLIVQYYNRPFTQLLGFEIDAYLEANEQMLYDKFVK